MSYNNGRRKVDAVPSWNIQGSVKGALMELGNESVEAVTRFRHSPIQTHWSRISEAPSHQTGLVRNVRVLHAKVSSKLA